MKEIAVLGPRQTFSDLACKKYFKHINEEMKIVYCPTIIKTYLQIKECKTAILPFENSLDGYVTETLDSLMKNDERVIAEVTCPIHFNFVSYENDIKKINKVYVQYKSKGQCQEFLQKNDFNCLVTQSNIESLELLKADKVGTAAIIPSHIDTSDFNLAINDVADNHHNETRFFVVSKDYENPFLSDEIKVSLCIHSLLDKPGILYHILSRFEQLQINLSGILSRPTRQELGNYNFYIEFNLDKKDIYKIDMVLKEFENHNEFKVKIIGVYSNIGVK